MATPARGTRSRAKQQDNPVATSLANAYGARGGGSLERQLEGTHTDLAQAFATHNMTGRTRTLARQSREAPVEPTLASPIKKSTRRTTTRASAIEELPVRARSNAASARSPSDAFSPSDMGPPSLQGTAIDDIAGYEAVIPPVNTARFRARTPSVEYEEDVTPSDEEMTRSEVLRRYPQPQVWHDLQNMEVPVPSDFRVALQILLNFFKQLLLAIRKSPLAITTLLLAALATAFFKVPRLPSNSLEAQRERMLRGARVFVGLPEWEQAPAGLEKEWIYFKHYRQFRPGELPDYNVPDLQWTININLVGRLEKLEKKTEEIATALDTVQSTISAALPRMVVVDDVDGRLLITDELYHALQQKIKGDEQIWSAFLDSNMDAIDRLENQRINNFFDEAQRGKHIVSAATALEMIQGETGKMQDLFEKNTDRDRAAFVRDIRSIAEDAVLDVLAKNAGGTFTYNEIQKNFFVQNTLDEMHKFNFFSPKAAASVNYRLTSPTAIKPQPNWLATLVAAWVFPKPNSPDAALLPWSSWSECWCAAASNVGMAQLCVQLPDPVVPQEFLIEHIPAGGTVDIANAPRQIELWMDAATKEGAEHIARTIAAESTRLQTQGPCVESPGDSYVCVGKGLYDIHHDNWVQTFPAFIDMTKHQFNSRSFIVKVQQNWGGDVTCLYRVRLHGVKFSTG